MCLDLKQFHEYLSREDSSNSECEEQKNSFLEGLTNAEEWALGSKLYKQFLQCQTFYNTQCWILMDAFLKPSCRVTIWISEQ